MKRKLLGSANSWASRTHVYLAEDAIEVDEIEGYTGTRKRILCDEVLLITLDRRRRKFPLAVMGGLCLCSGAVAAVAAAAETQPDLMIGATSWAIACLLMFLFFLFVGVDYVTIFGKRATAQIRFIVQKRRARAVFALLREVVGQFQERQRQRPAPVPAPDVVA